MLEQADDPPGATAYNNCITSTARPPKLCPVGHYIPPVTLRHNDAESHVFVISPALLGFRAKYSNASNTDLW